MPSLSILGDASSATVSDEPFAHIVRMPVFDQELYRALASGFPPFEAFSREGRTFESNQAVRIPASAVLKEERLSGLWKEFFEYHTSEAFWKDIVRVFGPALQRRYPEIEAKVGRPLHEWRVKRRNTEGLADVALDALFVINTPVENESSVRPAHVDYEEKIFAGLFYMREPGDTTPGGDLELFRFLPGRQRFGAHYARPKDLDKRRVVPYSENEFVGFVNSPDSVHGVSPRPKTTSVRRYVNFVAETPFAAFQLPVLPPIKRALFWAARRGTKGKGVTLDYS